MRKKTGRPETIPGKRLSAKITLNMREDEKEILEQKANLNGLSVSQMVRRFLREKGLFK